MNIMKYLPFAFIIAFSLVFTSCEKEEIQNATQTTTNAPTTEYQLTDVAIRSLNSSIYVKEFRLLDTEDLKLPVYLTVKGVEYSDNGRITDLVANDKVYTSIETFEHNAEVPYVD